MPLARLLFPTSTLALLLLACAGSTPSSTAFAPITGIVIRSDSLVSGTGCGKGDDEIFKYAAVVLQGSTPVAVGVFNCFADAKFADLQGSDAGSLSFDVKVYAFNSCAYEAQNTEGALDPARADWTRIQNLKPTYLGRCTATQQQDVEVLAVCEPLAPVRGTATVQIDTVSFQNKAGKTLKCEDKAYRNVEAFFRAGESFGQLPPVTCPAPIIVSAKAPATYTFDVHLLDPSAGLFGVATARCRACTTPGLDTKATCEPAE